MVLQVASSLAQLSRLTHRRRRRMLRNLRLPLKVAFSEVISLRWCPRLVFSPPKAPEMVVQPRRFRQQRKLLTSVLRHQRHRRSRRSLWTMHHCHRTSRKQRKNLSLSMMHHFRQISLHSSQNLSLRTLLFHPTLPQRSPRRRQRMMCLLSLAVPASKLSRLLELPQHHVPMTRERMRNFLVKKSTMRRNKRGMERRRKTKTKKMRRKTRTKKAANNQLRLANMSCNNQGTMHPQTSQRLHHSLRCSVLSPPPIRQHRLRCSVPNLPPSRQAPNRSLGSQRRSHMVNKPSPAFPLREHRIPCGHLALFGPRHHPAIDQQHAVSLPCQETL